jgi:hypothetical protein
LTRGIKAALAAVALTCPSLIGASTAIAADRNDPRCINQFNRFPQCSVGERRRLNARFGLPPIEDMRRDHAPKTDLIVAASTFKLGGGIAIIVGRNRKNLPYLEVRNAHRKGQSPARLWAQLDEASWTRIVAASRTLDTNLYEDDRICVGAAGFAVQALDADGVYRGRLSDVCWGHPGTMFFDLLSGIALANLPDCAALAPGGFTESWAGSKLETCFLTSGERRAAAVVFNLVEAHDFWSGWRAEYTNVRALIADDATMSWPGMPPIRSQDDVADFLTGGWMASLDFSPATYLGETAGSVRVTGEVLLDSDAVRKQAFGQFHAIWARDKQGAFKLERLVVTRD